MGQLHGWLTYATSLRPEWVSDQPIFDTGHDEMGRVPCEAARWRGRRLSTKLIMRKAADQAAMKSALIVQPPVSSVAANLTCSSQVHSRRVWSNRT